jgi:hypothetical protein
MSLNDFKPRVTDFVAAGGLDPYQRATLAFGLCYEEAVLDRMDELPRILGET